MATYYPENDMHVVDDHIDELKQRIKELEETNRELNIALMRKSAEASEAQEELKRCKLEWEIVADQKGHNLCPAAVGRALKATIGYTGKYPDPENITPEQFAQGCVVYHGDLFPDCNIRLAVIPKELDDKGILTAEQAEKGKKALGFVDGDKDV